MWSFCLVLLVLSAASPARGQAVIEFVVGEFATPCLHCDSYVLPLSDPADIAQARELIQLGPGPGRGAIAVANIAAGTDGINRDWLAPGAPEWSWHVTQFLEFAEVTIEVCDGWPAFVESDPAAWIQNTGGVICFWSYTVVAELPLQSGPALHGWGLPLLALLIPLARGHRGSSASRVGARASRAAPSGVCPAAP